MTPDWIPLLPEAARAQALAHLAMLESENRCLREILRLRRLERYGRGSESLTDDQLWLLAQETSLSAQELHHHLFPAIDFDQGFHAAQGHRVGRAIAAFGAQSSHRGQ